MRNFHHPVDSQPSDPLGPSYWAAIFRYLGWRGVVCLIAGFRAGPVMIVVWLTVAYVLTREPEPETPRPTL